MLINTDYIGTYDLVIYFGVLGGKKVIYFPSYRKKHIKWFSRKNRGFHSVFGSHEALSKTPENMQSQSTRAGTGGVWISIVKLQGKNQMGRWTHCMLLSLCLWSPREEEQIVHLYGLFLGLRLMVVDGTLKK